MIQSNEGKQLEYFLLHPLFQIQAMAVGNKHNDDQHNDLKLRIINIIYF